MLKESKAFSGFSVNSLEEAMTFYGDILGLEITKEEEGLSLHLGSGATIFIYPKSNHQPATFTILNFPVKNIEETVDALSEKGIQFEKYTGEMQTDEKGIMREGGPLIAWFKDPAGNFLSIIQD